MTESTEQRHGRRAVEFGPTGGTVAMNIARLRKTRGFTTRGLSAELRKYGRVIPPSAISRMESERRHVTVDDLTALASIFDVSPSALLLPPTDDPANAVEITGVGPVAANEAWDWMDGRRRLDQPCADPATAALEYALYSRPPIRRSRELGAA
ncbi:helix-turn-helix domain-containing protein [Streptomyces sp. NPDC096324]|uniref:helix-turn-helix domain-containing protein n=1 Tax=Streptomyces sp. NPDC096324 TaxID=3366085 RepID=UPI0037F15437